MQERLIELLILALAVHQIVNIWRFSSLFAGWRQWRDMGCGSRYLGKATSNWLVSLLDCPWCFSVHVAFWLYLAWLLGAYLVPIRWVIVTLSISQLANLLHHLAQHHGVRLASRRSQR